MANIGYSDKTNKKNNQAPSLKNQIYLSVVRTLEVCFVTLLCFGCCATLPRTPAAAPDYFVKDENVDHLLRSTVAIMTPGTGKPRCTGNFISPELIITARHCFMQETQFGDSPMPMEAQRAMAMSYDIPFVTYDMYEKLGEKDKAPDFPLAKIVYFPTNDVGDSDIAPVYDTIILKISSSKNRSKYWLPIAATPPKLASKVYGAQMPGGMPWILVDGRVGQYIYNRSKKPFSVESLLLTISLNHGASGSAVVNEKGEIVGMASTMDSTGNFARYVSSTIILEILGDYAESLNPKKPATPTLFSPDAPTTPHAPVFPL